MPRHTFRGMSDVNNNASTEVSALRRAREQAGLSMGELAKLAGVPKPSLQKWEAGVIPNVIAAGRLADALGKDTRDLWRDTALPAIAPAEQSSDDTDAVLPEDDEPTGPVVVRDGFDQTASVGG